MIDAAVITARIVQFVPATILFGAPLFFLYGLASLAPRLSWPRPLLAICAGVLAAGAAASLLAQTAVMAGDPAAALDLELLIAVLGDTTFGHAMVARFAAALAALAAALTLRPGPGLWRLLAGLGALVLASFAWTGHGAAEAGLAGTVHALADVFHLLAAGAWLGALAALAILLARAPESGDPAAAKALHAALAGFSGIGSALVAVIVATGLVNSWFLIGPRRILDMGESPYGLLLLVKLGLFVGMLGLAAGNRFQLTPDLRQGLSRGQPAPALRALRRSLFLEAGAGLLILGLVAVLGALVPVAAQ